MTSSARLEIHQINVGQGDSTLIINRDLDKVAAAIRQASKTPPSDPIDYVPYAVANEVPLDGTVKSALLIDGGDDEYGGDVLAYLKTMGALLTAPNSIFCPNLSILVSHYHADHIAGVRSIFKERVTASPATKKRKKNDGSTSTSYKERYRPAHVYQTAPNTKADPDTVPFAAFSDDVAKAFAASPNNTKRHFIDQGGFAMDTINLTKIDLGKGVNNIPITLHVLAAAQAVYGGPGYFVSIPSVNPKATDQNDRSIVLVLEYGSFRFFLGGDIAGNGGTAGGNDEQNAMDTSAKRFFSVHADVETTLGEELEAYFPATKNWKANTAKFTSAGYCTVLKADHHGSSSSVDVYLLATTRPCIVTIGSGVKSRFHGHPTQQVIDRMSMTTTQRWNLRKKPGTTPNTIKQVYATEVAQKVKGKAFDVNLRGARILGDIVIRPIDESIQAVQAATVKGTELQVQVYGSGAQTDIVDTRTELRPVTTPYRSGDIYPIGPFIHKDTH